MSTKERMKEKYDIGVVIGRFQVVELQAFDRDNQRFAFKASVTQYGDVWHDVWHDVWKDPIHGRSTNEDKSSKLIKENGNFKTVRQKENGTDLLQTVFKNGVLYNELTLTECRATADF